MPPPPRKRESLAVAGAQRSESELKSLAARYLPQRYVKRDQGYGHGPKGDQVQEKRAPSNGVVKGPPKAPEKVPLFKSQPAKTRPQGIAQGPSQSDTSSYSGGPRISSYSGGPSTPSHSGGSSQSGGPSTPSHSAGPSPSGVPTNVPIRQASSFTSSLLSHVKPPAATTGTSTGTPSSSHPRRETLLSRINALEAPQTYPVSRPSGPHKKDADRPGPQLTGHDASRLQNALSKGRQMMSDRGNTTKNRLASDFDPTQLTPLNFAPKVNPIRKGIEPPAHAPLKAGPTKKPSRVFYDGDSRYAVDAGPPPRRRDAPAAPVLSGRKRQYESDSEAESSSGIDEPEHRPKPERRQKAKKDDWRSEIWKILNVDRSRAMGRSIDSDDDMEATGDTLRREEARAAAISRREDELEEQRLLEHARKKKERLQKMGIKKG